MVKNKCAAPFKEAEFDIRWGLGMDTAADLLDAALVLGVVTMDGQQQVFEGESLGQGRDQAREALGQGTVEHRLREAVNTAFKNRT